MAIGASPLEAPGLSWFIRRIRPIWGIRTIRTLSKWDPHTAPHGPAWPFERHAVLYVGMTKIAAAHLTSTSLQLSAPLAGGQCLVRHSHVDDS